MPENDTEQHDFYRALATCEISFLGHQREELRTDELARLSLFSDRPTKVSFGRVARGCVSQTLAFDETRQKNVMAMNSTLATFSSDDLRPAFVRGLAAVLGDREPRDWPHFLHPLVRGILNRFGAGEVTVVQDLSKTVVGEIAAQQVGRDAPFFPADSWFDQFLLVKAMGRTFTNRSKLRVSSVVERWPPQGQIYKSEGVTPFYPVGAGDDSVEEPAFLFGNCTINIVEVLDEAAVEPFRQIQNELQLS